MQVHPYTFRADSNFLPFDLHGDFVNELIYYDKVLGIVSPASLEHSVPCGGCFL